MPSAVGAKPSGVRRVIFREFLPGDRKKKDGVSNISQSGGGARDLRYSPAEKFEDVVAEMFPTTRTEARQRGGSTVELNVRVGEVHWDEHGTVKSVEAVFEPPTDARPNEWRLRRVTNIPPIKQPPPEAEGAAFVILVENDEGQVWAHFATVASLRAGEWHESVSGPILHSFDTRAANKAPVGYIDFVAGTQWTSSNG